MNYPHHAGFTEPTTSKNAAVAIERAGRAETLRRKIVELFGTGFIGSSEHVAHVMKDDYVSVQPRISELKSQGIVEPTGETVKGRYGRPIKVWRLA